MTWSALARRVNEPTRGESWSQRKDLAMIRSHPLETTTSPG